MRFAAVVPSRHQAQAALLTCLILALSSWPPQPQASRGVRQLIPLKVDVGGGGLPFRSLLSKEPSSDAAAAAPAAVFAPTPRSLDSPEAIPSKYTLLSASSPVEVLGGTAQSSTADSVGPRTDATQPVDASETHTTEPYIGTADRIREGEVLHEGGRRAPRRDGSDVGDSDISKGGGDGGDNHGESEGDGGEGSDEYEDVRWLEEVMRPAWAESQTAESALEQHQQPGDVGAQVVMRPPAAIMPDGPAAAVSPTDGVAAAAAGFDSTRDDWPLPVSAPGGLPVETTSPPAGAEPGAASETAGVANGTSVEPKPLHYPVWWMAPFWSGSGYSSEAINYVLSLTRANLIRREDLWISHNGDAYREQVVASMAAQDREELRSLEANVGTIQHQELPPPRQQHPLQQQQQQHIISSDAGEGLPSRPAHPDPQLYPPTPRPAVLVCHSLPTNWQVPEPNQGSGDQCPPEATKHGYVYLVGRTMFETDRLPSVFVSRCNSMNEVWVPSRWAVDVFTSSGVDPAKLVVVPEGVNTTWLNPELYEPMPLPQGELVFGESAATHNNSSIANTAAAGSSARPFRLLSTFKWEPRKGWDVLLEAYLAEFTADDEIELYIITKPFVGGGDFKKHMHTWLRRAQRRLGLPPDVLTQSGRLPRLYVISSHISDADFPRYYRAADAFVLPSRGEGWGRPHVEAMAMGLPLIATNWSGITAYLDESVGYPIAVDRLTTVSDNSVWWFRGLKWAQPSVKHTRILMRRVYSNREEARARGAAARRRMVERYSPDVLAAEVAHQLRRIDRLLPKLPPPV